jgi:hypothetical protein
MIEAQRSFIGKLDLALWLFKWPCLTTPVSSFVSQRLLLPVTVFTTSEDHSSFWTSRGYINYCIGPDCHLLIPETHKPILSPFPLIYPNFYICIIDASSCSPSHISEQYEVICFHLFSFMQIITMYNIRLFLYVSNMKLMISADILHVDMGSLTLSNRIFQPPRILPNSYLFWAGKRLVGYL